ncbi:MAG: hypothetical protein J6X44_04780 [Thermoguttaceae bacterium]|nr:hypothetical protein [Thermoguttaceae bacterium]
MFSFIGVKETITIKSLRLKKKASNLQLCVYYFREIISRDFGEKVINNYMAYNTGNAPLGSWRLSYLYLINFYDHNDMTFEDSIKNNNCYNPSKSWNEEPNYSFHLDFLCWNNNPFSKRYNDTSVMSISGKDTAFETLQKATWRDVDDIFAQCSHTILMMEAVDSRIHWGQPGDFDIETVTKERLFPGKTKGILVLFGDGFVWYIERSVPMETLKHFMTIESSKEHDRQQELSKYGRPIE